MVIDAEPSLGSSPTGGGPIPIRLISPTPSATVDRMLLQWGAPPYWDFVALPLAIHHGRAGSGVFNLPPSEEIIDFAKRMRKRKTGHPLLVTLGYLCLFSQYSMAKISPLLAELRSLDMVKSNPISDAEWDELMELKLAVGNHRS